MINAKQNKIENEPEIALYSGKDGLDLYTKVLFQIKRLENKPEIVVFELDPRNINTAKNMLKSIGYRTHIWQDKNRLERVLTGSILS